MLVVVVRLPMRARLDRGRRSRRGRLVSRHVRGESCRGEHHQPALAALWRVRVPLSVARLCSRSDRGRRAGRARYQHRRGGHDGHTRVTAGRVRPRQSGRRSGRSGCSSGSGRFVECAPQRSLSLLVEQRHQCGNECPFEPRLRTAEQLTELEQQRRRHQATAHQRIDDRRQTRRLSSRQPRLPQQHAHAHRGQLRG